MLRAQYRWQHVSTMVLDGLVASNFPKREVNLFSIGIPTFCLGEELALPNAVPTEELLHRFKDTLSDSGLNPTVELFHLHSAKGMLTSAFWLVVLLEFRAKQRRQEFNAETTLGIDESYTQRLMLNMAYHYAVFVAAVEAMSRSEEKVSATRFHFFSKFAKLVVFSLRQFFSVNELQISECSETIERTVFFWTLGLTGSKFNSSSSQEPANATGGAAGNSPVNNDETLRRPTLREIKMKKYREIFDEQKMKKTPTATAAAPVPVFSNDPAPRLPLHARSVAAKKKVGTNEVIQVVDPEHIISSIQLDVMLKKLDDETKEATKKADERSKMELALQREQQVQDHDHPIPASLWNETPFSEIGTFNVESVTPLMKLFLEVSSLHSQTMISKMPSEESSCFQRATCAPVLQVTSASEKSLLRRRLPLCRQEHEMSLVLAAGGLKVLCHMCAGDACRANKYLMCDMCQETLCRKCSDRVSKERPASSTVASMNMSSQSSIGNSTTKGVPAYGQSNVVTARDVFGAEVAATVWRYDAPTGEPSGLGKKIIANRSSSGAAELLNAARRKIAETPLNRFDAMVQYATSAAHFLETPSHKIVSDAAAVILSVGADSDAGSDIALHAQQAPHVVNASAFRRPGTPTQSRPASATLHSRPASAMTRRPTSAMSGGTTPERTKDSILGAFMFNHKSQQGQDVRQKETFTSSPQRLNTRPTSAQSAGKPPPAGVGAERSTVSASAIFSRPATASLTRPTTATSNHSSQRDSSVDHSLRPTLSMGRRPTPLAVKWSIPQANDVFVLQQKRSELMENKARVLERVQRINNQQTAAEESRRDLNRSCIREGARNALECFQLKTSSLRKLRKESKDEIIGAVDEVVDAMEATTQRLHGLDEIDCVKTALIAINKHFEVLPEIVRKHSISFAAKQKPRLMQLILSYKLQYRDRAFWPPSLDNPARTRAMDAPVREFTLQPSAVFEPDDASSVALRPGKAAKEAANLGDGADAGVDESRDYVTLPASNVGKSIDAMLAAQEFDYAAEARIKAEQSRKDRAIEHQRHVQRLAGIEMKPIGGGLLVAGGQVLWAATNLSVGAEANEVRRNYMMSKMYR